MTDRQFIDRRTVLKTIGVGAAGGVLATGSAAAHGGDHRVPSWFEGEIWEMAERPPFGPLQDESTAPLWHIKPGAADMGCAQIEGFNLSFLEQFDDFEDGAWGSVDMDQTLSADPFSSLWHVHFVFDAAASSPYSPDDMVNQDQTGAPLIDGQTIRNAQNTVDVSIPFAFNCPIRPADDEHSNYCG